MPLDKAAVFTKLIIARQHYEEIFVHKFSPKSFKKCRKYGNKFSYALK